MVGLISQPFSAKILNFPCTFSNILQIRKWHAAINGFLQTGKWGSLKLSVDLNIDLTTWFCVPNACLYILFNKQIYQYELQRALISQHLNKPIDIGTESSCHYQIRYYDIYQLYKNVTPVCLHIYLHI